MNLNKLSVPERIEMLTRSVLLSQVAVLVGSALYYIFIQTRLLWQHGQPDGKLGSFINIWPKAAWDNLPVYLDHAFNTGWFEKVLPRESWYGDRHDVRHVMIGFLAAVLIGSLTVGLKKYKRASVWYMAGSVPLAFLAAIATTAGVLALFDAVKYHGTPVIQHLGFTTGNTWVADNLGAGAIELTLVGVLAGVAAKLILNRTFATLQLMSIERNIAQGDTVTGIRKYVYPAVYRKRFHQVEARVQNNGYECKLGNKWLGIVISAAIPFLVTLTLFGWWLNYPSHITG